MFGRDASRVDRLFIALLLAVAAFIWGLGWWETTQNH